MRTFLEDLRFAWRMLRKSPGFAFLAVATLALGLGATTAMYSVVSHILLRPLPYPEPDRIVRIWETFGNGGRGSVSRPNFEDWRAGSRTLRQLSAYMWSDLNFVGDGGAERLLAGRVTADLFPLLGARPVVGRTFDGAQFESTAASEVILSHELWQRRFAGERDIVGRTIQLSGKTFTVVGVVQPGFELPTYQKIALWLPYDRSRDPESEGRGNHYLQVLGRLAPGATLAQASAEMKTIAARIAADHPETQARRSVHLADLPEVLVGHLREAAWMLFGAVVLVLVIACANVANMLLARGAARKGELSVRLALGARRGRLVRQLLTEGLLLAIFGGAFGLLLAIWGVDLCTSAMRLPPVMHPALDAHAFVFASAAALASVLVFGLAPALGAARIDLADALKDGARRTTGGKNRLRSVFVVGQVALSFALLACAGLLVKSFSNVASVAPGFDPRGVATMQIALPEAVYDSDERVTGFYDRLREELRAVPGVSSVGLVNFLPFARNNINGGFTVEGRDFPEDTEVIAEYMVTTPGYFGTMGVKMVRGRDLTDGDRAGARPVMVINQALADRYFAGLDPLGKRITVGWSGQEPREIVGVVADMRRRGLEQPPVPEIYVPFAQKPVSTLTVAARFETGLENAAASMRRAVARVDAQQAVHDVSTLETIIDDSLAGRRVLMAQLGIFAAVALLLAALGMYGVVAVQVVQRTRELGIRMALGARAREVRRLVIAQGLRLVGLGLVVGIVLSLAGVRLIQGRLYGTSGSDPLTFAAAALALAAAALLASWIPARRATRIDPMIALRAD